MDEQYIQPQYGCSITVSKEAVTETDRHAWDECVRRAKAQQKRLNKFLLKQFRSGK